jgi:hypothetical protein
LSRSSRSYHQKGAYAPQVARQGTPTSAGVRQRQVPGKRNTTTSLRSLPPTKSLLAEELPGRFLGFVQLEVDGSKCCAPGTLCTQCPLLIKPARPPPTLKNGLPWDPWNPPTGLQNLVVATEISAVHAPSCLFRGVSRFFEWADSYLNRARAPRRVPGVRHFARGLSPSKKDLWVPVPSFSFCRPEPFSGQIPDPALEFDPRATQSGSSARLLDPFPHILQRM